MKPNAVDYPAEHSDEEAFICFHQPERGPIEITLRDTSSDQFHPGYTSSLSLSREAFAGLMRQLRAQGFPMGEDKPAEAERLVELADALADLAEIVEGLADEAGEATRAHDLKVKALRIAGEFTKSREG